MSFAGQNILACYVLLTCSIQDFLHGGAKKLTASSACHDKKTASSRLSIETHASNVHCMHSQKNIQIEWTNKIIQNMQPKKDTKSYKKI